MFTPYAFPSDNQYYNIIDESYFRINQLYNYNLFFTINKVNAHVENSHDIHEMMKNRVDQLAKDRLNNYMIDLDYNDAPYNYCIYNNNQLIKVYYRLKIVILLII